MTIHFPSHEHPTVGAEIELHVVDLESGELVPATSGLLDEIRPPSRSEAGQSGEFEHPRIKHELFESTIEIISEVGDTAADVANDLATSLAQVLDAAGRHGMALIGAGTHPFARMQDARISPNPRYHRLIEDMQWVIRRLAVCGLHVHVAVRDGDTAIRIINELNRYLPLLLAMSTSSPYFEGQDSGLASTRIKLFEMLPKSGLAPGFDDWAGFEDYMATLTDAGSIESIKDVWWSVRPQPDFGTIEIRICDAPSSLHDLLALVSLAQTLVAWCEERIDAGTLPPPAPRWMVEENLWLAARYGVHAELLTGEGGDRRRRPLRELAAELLDDIGPTAGRLGSSDLPAVSDLLAGGSSADRQRGIVADGGTLLDVVRHLADELAAPVRHT